ncbi:amino acid adenylation domain-containing protein [Brevibacillus sp. TJ4]|uniref:amino acid adenylation domain-containing protein n=1 Tax=Brevibacillus sp. TJ4 TaxID=3234853 RepID=UPI0037CE6CAA
MIELLARLKKEKIKVWIEGGKLRYQGPQEAIAEDLLGALRSHENEIVSLLKEVAHGKRTESAEKTPVPRKDKGRGQFPLSFAQKRLWFMEQLQPGTTFYNIQDVRRIAGLLNPEALKRSFDDLVKRHEALRTTFSEADEQPVQVIADFLPYPFRLEDISHLPEAVRETEATRIIEQDASAPFDLAHSLFRVTVVRLQPEEHILIMSMHHIISDGWSMGILFHELGVLYDAYVNNRPSPLRELPLQYSDYALWQHDFLQSERFQEELGYWKKQLRNAPALIELPTDFPRPAVQRYKGSLHTFSLSGADVEELETICQQNAATLFMGLLSIYKILLFRHSGQEDLVVGTVTANRNSTEWENMIGFFVNTLPIRTRFTEEQSFAHLLKEVRNACLGAFTHQEVPFEMLVEITNPERNLSYTPLVQTLCILQSASEYVEIGGLRTKRIEVDYNTAKFDLTFAFENDSNGLLCHVEYNTDLFAAGTIEKLARRFRSLVKSVIANPEKSIAQLQMITQAEKEKVLKTWNRTEAAPASPMCLHQAFEQQVLERPDSIALYAGKEMLTYRELNERANQLARHLNEMGVRDESRVGICVERSFDMLIGILAILKAGGAYVPIDPHYPDERKQYILQDSQAEILLTSSQLDDSYCEKLTLPVITFEGDRRTIASYERTNPQREVRPDQLAYIIYTSGSTGRPKGVMVPHSNVIRLFANTQRWFHFHASDKWALFHSFAFDFSVWEIWGALLYGGQLVIVPYRTSRSADEFYELVAREGITVLNQTPSAFYQFAKADERLAKDLEVRCIIFGGEALEPEKLKGWLEKHGDAKPSLVNMYGITETTVHVTYRPITKADMFGKSMIGEKISDLELYILDKQLEPVPVGVAGEMYIGGAGLARGYNSLPKMTAERFIPNPFSSEYGSRLYKTGDAARFTENGDVEYLGRIDRQVKIRGFRIELEEIQKTLRKHPAVQDAHAIVHQAGDEDKRIAAYYIVKPGCIVEPSDLQEFARGFLPIYMVPAWFQKVDAFPLTENGKIDEKSLPLPAADRALAKQALVLPRNRVEEALAGIWRDTLQLEEVGIHDNFFELGGHSFTAVQLIRKVEKEFGKTMPTSAIFQYPTIEGFSRLLAGLSERHTEGVMVELRQGRTQQALCFIHPVGGTIFCYSKLVSLLTSERTMYGFKSAGLDGKESAATTIQEMARHYVSRLLEVGKEEPVLLGWSMGGIIAFEMGLQLYDQLGRAPKLIMIDSWAKDVRSQTPDKEEAAEAFIDDIARSSGISFNPDDTPGKDRMEQLFFAMKEAGIATTDSDVSYIKQLFSVYTSNLRALRAYSPSGKYPGDIVLLRASESVGEDHALGWNDFSSNPVKVSVIPGDHYSIFTEPSLSTLAKKVEESL